MKIGILTHYYNSVNYGGNLQAYALCTVLKSMGHEAEQVQTDHARQYRDLLQTSRTKPLLKKTVKLVKKPFKAAAWLLLPAYRRKRQARKDAARTLQAAFSHFNRELIPHGQQVFDCTDIARTVKDYDAFITGSDQVWNPMWYFPPYFLTFVPKGVPKFSYAASIAQTELPEAVKAQFREDLKDFIGVSVREENAVALLQGVAPGEVECVLDPTMLLTAQQWNAVASPRQVEMDYVFCYFLGDDPASRQVATEYAKNRGLTLVTIPNAAGQTHKYDADFGDICLSDPSPEDFLSLIAHADFVFTDSFHASVFSLIYSRQFAVFARQGHEKMSARIYSLTALFDVPERFCDTADKTNVSYVEDLPVVDYRLERPKFQAAKERSVTFLKSNLEKAEEMLQS